MSASSYPRPYGPYVLLEMLGRGGMSEVELARQAVGEANYVRLIVIKRIHAQHTGDEGFVRMFQDEARINAELQHENIAQVYEFGRVGNEYYLAMEFVGGMDVRTVQHHLARLQEPFPLPVALRIIYDVLAALDYAHGRVDTYGRPMHIVHRDVNPRNVMLSNRGEVKLIDFGVAKADTKSEQTVGHAIKGKYAYMAPEQIDGNVPLDGRADLFAVGLMLHELITGRSPLHGLSEVQIIHKILSGKLPPIGEIPDHPQPELIQIIHRKSLMLDREERYVTAGAMRQAIQEAAEPLGGLPDAQTMAEFLVHLDPEESHRLAERLVSYGKLDLREFTTAQQVHSESIVQPSTGPGLAGLHTQPTLVDPDAESTEAPTRQRSLLVVLSLVLVVLAGVLALDFLQGQSQDESERSTRDRDRAPKRGDQAAAASASGEPGENQGESLVAPSEPDDEAEPTRVEPVEPPPSDEDPVTSTSLEPQDSQSSVSAATETSTASEADEQVDETEDTPPDELSPPEDALIEEPSVQTPLNTHLRILVSNPDGRSLEILIDDKSHGSYVNARKVYNVTAGPHKVQLRDLVTGTVLTENTLTEVGGTPPIVRF